MNNTVRNLSEIKEKLKAVSSGSLPQIIAVGKTFPASSILPLLESGHRLFAENKVQEARAKWPELKKYYPAAVLHLIGPLQTNKVRDAMQLFDVIESLDRERLAREIAKERDKSGNCPELLIQVNTGEEPQKSGISPREVDAFILLCKKQFNLPVKGLMCIPPAAQEPAPHFALLKKIADRNKLETLSMGMSKDFEMAASLGATHVRIGGAIFGER